MGCIYNITNKVNGAVYVGSTIRKDPRKRWWRHVKDLQNNIHHSRFLQRAWNKYERGAFQFSIVEEVDDENILKHEQKHLDNRKLNFPKNLNYNTCWVAGNCKGRKFSQKTIEKLKKSHVGIHPTEETKLKQSLVWDEKCKVPYSFTNPSGNTYSGIRNLRRFGRDHNLDPQSLRNLNNGNLHTHKGWIKTGNKKIVYEAVDKDGNKYNNIIILKKFCKDRGINYKMIHKYCIKRNKPYKGWMVIRKEI